MDPVLRMRTAINNYTVNVKISILFKRRSNMTTFYDAVKNSREHSSNETRTDNGMPALISSTDPVVDLFYKIGSSRDIDITPYFIKSYAKDALLSLRIALWARDIRGGAGERKTFRAILQFLRGINSSHLAAILRRVPDVGRFDDLLVVDHPESYEIISRELGNKNSLCAKWMPRKGSIAARLRKNLKLSPKQYRKLLVSLTTVVESKMCANAWTSITYPHVPSKAMNNYSNAFNRHDPEGFLSYKESLKNGDVTINAATLYPYDLINAIRNGKDLDIIIAQWDALPNYMGSDSILAMVDVSGSMDEPVNDKSKITRLEIAISLGLYLSDKNSGKFKDMFLTFSESPDLMILEGNLPQKMLQMENSHWGQNTDLEKAFTKVLEVAVRNNVPYEEMPSAMIILSDMQFDSCIGYDDSAMAMIRRQYHSHGYKAPNIIFWNLGGSDNIPVNCNEHGCALISGFSPGLMKSLLADPNINPQKIMRNTIMNARYDFDI